MSLFSFFSSFFGSKSSSVVSSQTTTEPTEVPAAVVEEISASTNTITKLNSMTGLALIKNAEGCKLTAYQDSVGVWTIGWGQTGDWVKAGVTITQEQADNLLIQSYTDVEAKVKNVVKVSLNQNQLGALVSFTYNVGIGNLSASTLLRLLNKGDYVEASGQFPLWNKAGGKILAGLVKRRAAEQTLFNTPDA